MLKQGCTTANISTDELIQRAWTTDYQRLPAVDIPMLADPEAALPQLLAACRRLVDSGKVDQGRIKARVERIGHPRRDVGDLAAADRGGLE
jgi:hypothetical protein